MRMPRRSTASEPSPETATERAEASSGLRSSADFQPARRGCESWSTSGSRASGAVSATGSLAALGGAALVAAVAAALTGWVLPGAGAGAGVFVGATLGGLAGSFFDSLLGATVQAIYWCPKCKKETERHPRHSCGEPTTLQRGRPWMNNDAVNFLASAMGAATGLLFAVL